ncbi:hypothetical protein MMC09_000389 [Bachmanniomyces sp. S44760]|nr:hypothetical protein [Bachmanniomyces sp. S44760]
MGIKGIYAEIGPGERVALSKLAIQKLEKTGRPLKVAVDISIWQFQTQSGRGGSNPALRTLYHRLVRLISLSIQPLFVFDGPFKPPFKRNARTCSIVGSILNAPTQQLLSLFGFPYHIAPGEAEAECALLQKEGIVDAVMSEDVDTIMFGCTLTFRNWSSGSKRGNKSPTHVDVYDAEVIGKGEAGFDRNCMILIALMSGGDYHPAGIPGCGIKLAGEAAKAGFGADLCKISQQDAAGLCAWRGRLQHELRTNESRYFRTKHQSIHIPETFPDRTVLGYYTHPVVSDSNMVSHLRESIHWGSVINITGLRDFVGEAFKWRYLAGAKKFIKGVAPALLVHKLRCHGDDVWYESHHLQERATKESQLVKAIRGRRTHMDTDGVPELHIEYRAADVVNLDLGLEEVLDPRDDLSDTDAEELASDTESRTRSISPKKKAQSRFDPNEMSRLWVLETIMKLGAPITVETWEEDMRNPVKFATRKAREREAGKNGGMKSGAMMNYLKSSKPSARVPSTGIQAAKAPTPTESRRPQRSTKDCTVGVERPRSSSSQTRHSEQPRKAVAVIGKSKQKKELPMPLSPSTAERHVNPWTLSRRPPDTFDIDLQKTKRYSALGILGTAKSEGKGEDSQNLNHAKTIEKDLIVIDDSPISTKHSRSPSPRPESDGKGNSERESTAIIPPVDVPNHEVGSINALKPSPRKKRPPVNQDKIKPLSEFSPELKQRTAAERVNRVLNFTGGTSDQAISITPGLSALPAPSASLPLCSQPQVPSQIALAHRPRPVSNTKVPRSCIVLRQSLKGAWKKVDQCELQGKVMVGVYEGVEILDLSTC